MSRVVAHFVRQQLNKWPCNSMKAMAMSCQHVCLRCPWTYTVCLLLTHCWCVCRGPNADAQHATPLCGTTAKSTPCKACQCPKRIQHILFFFCRLHAAHWVRQLVISLRILQVCKQKQLKTPSGITAMETGAVCSS